MQAINIRNTLESMSKDDLINLVMENGIDRAFGIMTRNMAELFHSTIESDKYLVFVDLANIHAANHSEEMGYMAGVDEKIRVVTDNIRHSDLVIRWGGDEIVIVLNRGDINTYLDRLESLMLENNLYCVYGIVKTSDSLTETVKRADRIVNAVKDDLERSGKKPGRNEPYKRLDSVTVYE